MPPAGSLGEEQPVAEAFATTALGQSKFGHRIHRLPPSFISASDQLTMGSNEGIAAQVLQNKGPSKNVFTETPGSRFDQRWAHLASVESGTEVLRARELGSGILTGHHVIPFRMALADGLTGATLTARAAATNHLARQIFCKMGAICRSHF
ncbi:hypothetical protein [Bradyrhizobium sp. USDA 4454]